MDNVLNLTTQEARILSFQCEFYARMRMGQFAELPFHYLDIRALGGSLFSEKREQAEALLFRARKFILPGLGAPGHSYGIGRFDDADLAFDIHQVIRRLFGDSRNPFSYHTLPRAWRTIADGEEMILLKLEPEHIPVLEKVKAFCESIDKGKYDVIADLFADPQETTEEGRDEVKKILSQVKDIICG